MKVSIIIPTHNDFEYLPRVIWGLFDVIWENATCEFILVNDGSVNPNGSLMDIRQTSYTVEVLCKVIDNPGNFGVGYSFDRGVSEAQGDIVILTACDIFPKGDNWLKDVIDAVQSHPNEIGCCTTLGLSPDNLDMKHPNKLYYGAELLWTYEGYKEEWKSKLLRSDGHYNSILNGQWNDTFKSWEPYKISCLMGGFYFCTKEFYVRMHGFDTYKGDRFRGHMKWGHLEPMLSLKAEMYGEGIRLYPEIEVGHIFNRKVDGARSGEYQYWNKLWMAYTMLEESFRDELRDYLTPNLYYNIAQHWIRQHKHVINETRQRNIREARLINKPKK